MNESQESVVINSQPKTNSRLKILIFIAGLIILVLLLAAGAFFYYTNEKSNATVSNKQHPFSNDSSQSASTRKLPMYQFSGTIVSITKESVVVETLVGDDKQPPHIRPPQLKKVTVTILPETEFKQRLKDEIKEVSVKDIKKGMTIFINTDLNTASTNNYYASSITITSGK